MALAADYKTVTATLKGLLELQKATVAREQLKKTACGAHLLSSAPAATIPRASASTDVPTPVAPVKIDPPPSERKDQIRTLLEYILSADGESAMNRPNDPNNMGPAQTKLVADLSALPPSIAREVLLRKAKEGRYGDFSETSGVCPEMELHSDLLAGGYSAMAQKVEEGEYDGY